VLHAVEVSASCLQPSLLLSLMLQDSSVAADVLLASLHGAFLCICLCGATQGCVALDAWQLLDNL
jgi:hypothetical protein